MTVTKWVILITFSIIVLSLYIGSCIKNYQIHEDCKQRDINYCKYECLAARNSEINCDNWCNR